MHELAVTESILNIAAKHAAKAQAKKVTDVHIVIGGLSSIVDESVQFYWEIICEDTLCANSHLHFKRIPARFRCLDCNHEFNIRNELTPCPQCGHTRVKIESGEEFYIESIEIEK
jgi:hydrogenase nickel incorporation protein HypA/HybF